MKYFDHTAAALFSVVAASVDPDLVKRRENHAKRLRAEHERITRQRQRILDGRIVDKREALVAARRAHERVKRMVDA